ncbi:DEAD/DEAH box helicase [Proteinivorax hydrogeniformans]|uniref:RNA helicase n=1 Tax=Proteinivorax hydrogeniformans TaxID=1826727 RepID=A0AAU8HSN1_9FIRM
MKFTNLGVSQRIVQILDNKGITKPTEVQVKSIPPLLKGSDVVCQAQTGTGKTYAFLLPIFEKIDPTISDLQAVIITPTRELAIQITAEAKRLAEGKDVTILSAYGGKDIGRQTKKLHKGVQLVIGTPGRLQDYIAKNKINLGRLSMVVLDEADQMFHMGFLEEVEAIMQKMPKKERQTMLFSATMPGQIRALASRHMSNIKEIKIQGSTVTLDDTKQLVILTSETKKVEALCNYIEENHPFMAIIFCHSKQRAVELNMALRQRGYNCEELHGELSQSKREKVMKDFRNLKTQFLVATDLAARGLDIEGITHIFNYDTPQNAEWYIHRIGRTGRMGEKGVAITFVTPKDQQKLAAIERGIKLTLSKKKAFAKDGKFEAKAPKRKEKPKKVVPKRPSKKKLKKVKGVKRKRKDSDQS